MTEPGTTNRTVTNEYLQWLVGKAGERTIRVAETHKFCLQMASLQELNEGA